MEPKVERISPSGRHFFFGYYDKTPWDPRMARILSMECFISGRLPTSHDSIDIGFFEKDKYGKWDWNKVDETNAWNFQQGCMLQWLDQHSIIYNTIVEDKICSKVYNVSTGDWKLINRPVYSVAKDKTFFLSVNFGLIHRHRPGYGYSLGNNISSTDYSSDGIFKIDLNDQKESLLVPYSFFIDSGFVLETDHFWVDHLLHNQDDSKITFLLRCLTADGGVYSRLFVMNSDGDNLICLLDTGMASHADWLNRDTFSIWGRKQNFVKTIQQSNYSNFFKPLIKLVRKVGVPNRVRSKVYGDAFMHIKLDRQKYEIETFAKHIPANEGGGHFTFEPSGTWMLNDTPIDILGYRFLMIYNLKENKRVNVDKLKTPVEINFTPWRCDLHPRWSPCYKKIIVDSIHEGHRGMYVYSLTGEIDET